MSDTPGGEHIPLSHKIIILLVTKHKRESHFAFNGGDP
jgi:hypothetical protein